MKNNYLYPLIITILMALALMTSCTKEQDLIRLEEEIAETEIMEQTEVQEESGSEATDTNPIFRVIIENRPFNAYHISAFAESGQIHIVATNEEDTETLFLTFAHQNIGTFFLGRSEENAENNLAGYLLNDQNKGYMTTAMYGTCGEITVDKWEEGTQTISGHFTFKACDSSDQIRSFRHGIFKNLVLTED